MTTNERVDSIQKTILDVTGLKTSVKVGSLTSSMRGYVMFRAAKVAGQFTQWTFEQGNQLRALFAGTEEKPTTGTFYELCVYFGNEAYNYERAPKTSAVKKEAAPASEKVTRSGWGSKNSQMRLDKASRRYAKRLRTTNCARY